MPNLGEQPTSTNRDRIGGNEKSAESTKKQLTDALAAEDYAKVAELGGQMKSLQGQKEEFINKDEEEAHAENAERKDYNEAKAEDAERTKEKEEAEARAKELEELKLKDKAESTEKAAEILKKINGGSMKDRMHQENVEPVAVENPNVKLEDVERKKKELEKEYVREDTNLYNQALEVEKKRKDRGKLEQETNLDKKGDLITGIAHPSKKYYEDIRILMEESDAINAKREKIKGEYEEQIKVLGKSQEKAEYKSENIYGMNSLDLVNLLKSRGFLEEGIKTSDPNFKQKMDEFYAKQKSFGQAEVKLFDRVLSGKATEKEMKIAEEHATNLSKNWSLEGFNSIVPKAWYTNERIANAMAEADPHNKNFIERVKKNYSNEDLLKQYRVIDENGSVVTYERK